MQNEWILDVLVDLQAFARQNGLFALADQLDDTRLLAALELARDSEGTQADDRRPLVPAGQLSGGVGRRI
ncbi:hypothetical protein SAMN05443432_101532 [Roseovarius litoreus]|uniref:Uncharacterized protein n=1 Tax=Roseovarius litoreus TaxID=1155722 RepID=A0A1M7APP7_9RHOB|nr:hypothetical protein [Roseovarius litoreus]SHL44730.1 hypothetical protein SAMN05443432_101532 [Roseovarius litoreus]